MESENGLCLNEVIGDGRINEMTVIAPSECDSNDGLLDESFNECEEPAMQSAKPREVVRDQIHPSVALLPPDHPLLEKFQQSLCEYLMRTKEQLANELDEMKYNIRQKEQEREEAGAKLFDLQQELRHQNDQLDKYTQEMQTQADARLKAEAGSSSIKAEYDQRLSTTKELKTVYNRRMMELEHTQQVEQKLRQWTLDMEDEVKNAKRTVSRDAQLQRQLSEDKRRSDMLFLHLDVEVKKREQDLEVVSEELRGMRDVMEVLNTSITGANTDLEVLQQEHKRLSQSWGQVIVAITHRDKILLQVQTAVNKEKERIKLCHHGIEAIKKQISKELEQNEKLEAFKTRLANDFSNLNRECQKEAETLAALEHKLEELPDVLERTEKDLIEAKREGNVLETELRRLQLKLEKQYNKKFAVEEQILKLAQEQLINDKASQYRLKLLYNAQEQRRAMEITLAQAQNQLAETLLELERLKGQLLKLRQENDVQQAKLATTESRSDHLNTELKGIETQIDLKMVRMDKLSAQLELLRSNEGSEISPTELKMKALEKSLQMTEQQIREQQQFWLMLQNHFVNLSQKRNNQLNEIQITRKQLSIIKQKSLKIDTDLEHSEVTTYELSRDIQLYTSRIELLNEKVFKKRNLHDNEESECELEHSQLLDKLKDNEMKVLGLEAEIDELQVELDHYKDLVLDKHREALSWETKFKLIEETLRWRKSERVLDSEIGNMKLEIHRMQIRYNQLRRAQEKLVQDLDHSVMHREQIFVAAATKKHMETKPAKAATTTQNKIADLNNKLKLILNEIATLSDQHLVELQQEQQVIYKEVKALRGEFERVSKEDALIRKETEESHLLKHHNLEQIVRKQNRAKAYRRLSSTSSLPPKVPRSEVVDMQSQKQNDINDGLFDVVQSLITEFSERKPFFLKITQIIRD